MGMQMKMVGLSVALGLVCVATPVWAADGQIVEAAEAPAPDLPLEQLRTAIQNESDPELRAVMEEQLQLFESGELDLSTGRNLTIGGPAQDTTQPQQGEFAARPMLGGPLVSGTPGSVTDTDGTTNSMPNYMTPELKEQLFNVYDGVSRGQISEEQARSQAEGILKEHGIDPREMGQGQGHEGMEREGPGSYEHAFEQMSPEGREQMERQFGFEREGSGGESHREMESFQREFETQQGFEAPEREMGMEREMSPERTYEAPTHEFESPTREYEAPTHEYDAPEAPESPETPEAPQYESPESPEILESPGSYEPPPQP